MSSRRLAPIHRRDPLHHHAGDLASTWTRQYCTLKLDFEEAVLETAKARSLADPLVHGAGKAAST
jgi:hypothetical protein